MIGHRMTRFLTRLALAAALLSGPTLAQTPNIGSPMVPNSASGGGSPSGAAGGVLSGTYPNPGYAVQPLVPANNLSDLVSASAARSALGLGTAAVQNTGTSGANLPFLNGTNTWSGQQTHSSGIDFNGTTNPGLRINNLTTTQINALTPLAGMIVYDSTLLRFTHYTGSAWDQWVRRSGDTMTGALTITPAVNTTPFVISGYSNTGTTDFPILDLSGTVNNSGLTWRGIKLNVTDTTSAAASLLMDLQIAGTSRFAVGKTGAVTFNLASPAGGNPQITLISGSNKLYAVGATTWIGGGGTFGVLDTELVLGSGSDVRLFRDAANSLALQNGTNAQKFSVYNTWSSSGTNYERASIDWQTTANWLRIGTSAAGTGASRNIYFDSAGGIIGIGGTTSSFPAIKRNGAALNFRLADDSADAAITAGGISITAGAGYLTSGRGGTYMYADGSMKMQDNANTGAAFFALGGTTSSFPALKRSTTTLQARLADDSAYAPIQGKLTTDTAYTAGVTVASGYITLYDSTGTAYKVNACTGC
jgi:hypothetical protein